MPISTTLSGATYPLKDGARGTGSTDRAMATTNANHGSTPGLIYTNTSNTRGDGKHYIAGRSSTYADARSKVPPAAQQL